MERKKSEFKKKCEVLVFIVLASGIRFGERKIDPGGLTLREISS